MSIKEKLGLEQWRALFNAPSAASVFVSMANGSGYDIFKEFFSADKFIKNFAKETKTGAYGSLVDDFTAEVKSMSAKEAAADAIEYQSETLAGVLVEAKKIAADGAAVASNLPEGDGYKRWVLDTARKLAETKSGGFMGIGAVSAIDDKKLEALMALKTLLGV